MRKHLIIGIITVVLLGVIAYGYYQTYFNQTAAKQPHIPANEVSVVTVNKKTIPIVIKANGELMARDKVTLRSQTTGVVETVNFEGGDRIKQDRLLVKINDARQQADVDSAQAKFREAEKQYQRFKTLFQQQHSVSAEALDGAKSRYLQAKAAYEKAKHNLAITKMTAPFEGVITATDLTKGSYVNTGDTIATLIDKENLMVEYPVPERYANKISLGQTVNFMVDAFPEMRFQAKVYYISPMVERGGLSFRVRAEFNNNKRLLSPGMQVHVQQILDPEHQGLVIPERALFTQGGQFVVYEPKDGYAKAVHVNVRQVLDGDVEITSGVQEGDQVIVSSLSPLSDGQKVKISKGAE